MYNLQSADYYGRGREKRILLKLTNSLGKSIHISQPRGVRSNDMLIFDANGRRVGSSMNAPRSLWGSRPLRCEGNKTLLVRYVDVFYSYDIYDQYGAEVPYPLMVRIADIKRSLVDDSPYRDGTPSF